jgi:hypothetical protein
MSLKGKLFSDGGPGGGSCAKEDINETALSYSATERQLIGHSL